MVKARWSSRLRPGGFDASGNAKASWTGTIRFNQNGRDTTFNVKVPYTVTKPVMQIQSASVQALYFKCGNKLNVRCLPWVLSTSLASRLRVLLYLTGCQDGDVTLVPNSKRSNPERKQRWQRHRLADFPGASDSEA